MDRLRNAVRRYDWGSPADLPAFLGVAADGGPQAELWMGAHPDDSSVVIRDGAARPLREVIAADPDGELGSGVTRRFGPRLPFLFKVLAAGRPLSLQVHPDLAQARAAYAAQAGAAGDYTDDNHKPELICALRDGFQALSGFRPVAATVDLLGALDVPDLKPWAVRLAAGPDAEALREVVTEILTGPADQSAAVGAVATACARLTDGPWAGTAAAYARLAGFYPRDPGVLVALLLNHAVLAAGQALFVGAGVPHCYLEGLGAEIMASSDNVLRAGLTGKRVNVPELLRILDFRPAPLRVLAPERDGAELTYPVPVDDFRLSRIDLTARPVPVPVGRPEILLCTTGTATLAAPDGTGLTLSQGESVYLPADNPAVTATGPGTVLRATVGG
jgi:mannose-6-phosphate isomerase